jgi:hypothetical protein
VSRPSSRRSASHGPGGSSRTSSRPTACHSNGEAKIEAPRGAGAGAARVGGARAGGGTGGRGAEGAQSFIYTPAVCWSGYLSGGSQVVGPTDSVYFPRLWLRAPGDSLSR